MSLYLGNEYISKNFMTGEKGELNAISLFDFKWCDHLLTDNSWKRADTFEWIDGNIYSDAYNLLLEEYNATGTTETENGVTYKRTINQFKIAAPDQEANTTTALNTYGTAWFYILDIINKKFKLPRTIWGFTGLRDAVGKYVEAGLPNITGSIYREENTRYQDIWDYSLSSGCFKNRMSTINKYSNENTTGYNSVFDGVDLDASLSNPIYGRSETVQPPATQMYLYFYLTDTVRNKLDVDITDFINNTNTSLASKLNTSQITNCITEIPQNIKLEITSDKQLTLKAGSKVYIPDGFEADGVTKKYIITVLETDAIGFEWLNSADKFLVYYGGKEGNFVDGSTPTRSFSGTAFPENPEHGWRYFRTDLNKIFVYRQETSSWVEGVSFPIAEVTSVTKDSSFALNTINQIFNGFGYIGSNYFILPEVKGIIPNGKNINGTLNNLEFNTTAVLTKNVNINNLLTIGMNKDGNLVSAPEIYNVPTFGYIKYDIEKNITYASEEIWPMVFIGKVLVNDLKIIEFKPNLPINLLTYNNTNFISTQAFPSNKWLDLSLGASGTLYTAPANGYFEVVLNCGGKWANISTSAGLYNAYGNSTYANANFPVKKGDKLIITYESGVTKNIFKFIYAEGEVY